MALIGQGVNPVPIDYSMIGNDAWRVAQSNVSAIGGVIDAVKDRRDKKDAIKTSKKLAEAMSVLYPEAAGALGPVIAELDNEEAPLSQRAALGAQIGEFINMGVQKSRDNALMNLETQRLGLEGRRVAIAEAMPEREAEVARAEASQESTSAMDEAISRYIAIQEEELEFGDKIPKMEESNNLISKFIESGDGKAALSAVDAYEKARRAQIAPLREGNTGPKLTKIGGTDEAGRPIEVDAFVTEGGGVFDIQGNPLNRAASAARETGRRVDPPFGQKPSQGQSVLPPVEGAPTTAGDFLPPIPGERIQPMPKTQIGVRPVRSVTQTPEQIQEIRRGEMGDKRLAEIQTNAATLSGNLGKLKETQALLDKVRTGFGAEAMTAAKRILPGVSVANEEQLQTLLGDQVMARVGETKGAVSEKEMDLFQQYSANFGKTTEGNKRIVAFAIKAAERAKKIDAVITSGLETGKSPFEIQREVKAIQDSEPLETTLGDAPATPQDAKTRLQEMKKRLGQ